jgi:acetolactate synthase I/III small subunit
MIGSQKEVIINVLVDHKPGVLYKVSDLFRRRAFNISNVAIGTSERDQVARMTLTMRGSEADAMQLVKHLENLVDVISAEVVDSDKAVVRELALVKLAPNPEDRLQILSFVDVYRAKIVHLSDDSMIVEASGDSDKINALIELSRKFGLKEVARTGVTALSREQKPSESQGNDASW